MRIAVVNLPSVDGGGLSILRQLHAFAQLHVEHEWLFAVGPQQLAPSPHVYVERLAKARRTPAHRLIAETTFLPRLLRGFGADATLSLQNTRIPRVPGPQWVYLHQPLPFQDYAFSFRRRDEWDSALRQHALGAVIKRSLRSAEGVFVQTRWMQSAVSEALGGRVPVIHVGFSGLGRTATVGQFNPAVGDRFFYPAGPAVYKNFARLHQAVRLVAEVDEVPQVVLTLTESEFRRLAHVSDGESTANYEFLGRIPPEQVDQLYEKTMLVFPSFVESLGLPLLEARERRRLILAADCSYARDVLDGYPSVLLFDPFDPRSIADAILRARRGRWSLDQSPGHSPPAQNPWEIVLQTMERRIGGGRPQ